MRSLLRLGARVSALLIAIVASKATFAETAVPFEQVFNLGNDQAIRIELDPSDDVLVFNGGTYILWGRNLEIHAGRMPGRPFVLVGQQYLADPSRSVGEVQPVWTYAHVPNGYTGDATEAIIIVWGPVGITHQPPAWLAGTLDLGITFYPKYRFAVMLFTGCLVVACWLFVDRTRYGAIIRAGIEDREMASALGINIRRVFTVAFAVGTGLAGLGGALVAPVHGLLPGMGVEILPFAFVVVVLGGLGSLPGAIVAGLLVGIVQSLTIVIWAPAANVGVFALMALGLILRPQGLLGAR